MHASPDGQSAADVHPAAHTPSAQFWLTQSSLRVQACPIPHVAVTLALHGGALHAVPPTETPSAEAATRNEVRRFAYMKATLSARERCVTCEAASRATRTHRAAGPDEQATRDPSPSLRTDVGALLGFTIVLACSAR